MSTISVGDLRAEHEYDYGCAGSVVVETNGPQGGGPEQGAYLRLTFHDRGTTSMNAEILHGPAGEVAGVSIAFFGDQEIYAAEECLEFALLKLRQYRDLLTDPMVQVEE